MTEEAFLLLFLFVWTFAESIIQLKYTFTKWPLIPNYHWTFKTLLEVLLVGQGTFVLYFNIHIGIISKDS
jgi:hypothetical protein